MRSIPVLTLLLLSLLPAAALSEGPAMPSVALDPERIAAIQAGDPRDMDRLALHFGMPDVAGLIQHSDQLGLDPFQHGRIAAIRDQTATGALNIGAELLAQEAQLEALFRNGLADPRMVDAYAGQIGLLKGRLRGLHLNLRVQLWEVLSETQRELWLELSSTAERPLTAASGRVVPATAAASGTSP